MRFAGKSGFAARGAWRQVLAAMWALVLMAGHLGTHAESPAGHASPRPGARAASDQAARAPARECEIAWQFTPKLEGAQRRIDVEMRFNARGQRQTDVRLPDPWSGVEDYADNLRDLRVVNPGAVMEAGRHEGEYRISHLPDEVVRLRYSVFSPLPEPEREIPQASHDGMRTQLWRDGFSFFGHGAFLVPAGLNQYQRRAVCVEFSGLQPGDSLATSFGTAEGPEHRFSLDASVAQLQDALYLGGGLRLMERRAAGQRVVVALQAKPVRPWRFKADALADAVTQVVSNQRSFWREMGAPYLLVSVLPNHRPTGVSEGIAVHQAFALHITQDLTVPGTTFETLINHEHLHTWFPARFGTMGDMHQTASGEYTDYWFSEGFADFYAHRLLLQAGTWTLSDYAKTLNQRIAQYSKSPSLRATQREVGRGFHRNAEVAHHAYWRGEFLALRWHQSLQKAGRPGLDETMRGLILQNLYGTDLRRYFAPASETVASARLIGALTDELGPEPRRDVQRYIERGEPFVFDDTAMGPCFTLRPTEIKRWSLGMDRKSFEQHRVIGIDPAGPAYAAGLREGQALAGFQVQGGDINREVLIQLREGNGHLREIRYLPVVTEPGKVPHYEVRPGAERSVSCRAWVGTTTNDAWGEATLP